MKTKQKNNKILPATSSCCGAVVRNECMDYFSIYIYRDLILTLHHYNNCTTTTHMKVGLTVWSLPSCKELLFSCCIDVVNLTFFIYTYIHIYIYIYICCRIKKYIFIEPRIRFSVGNKERNLPVFHIYVDKEL
jgi:hypothetical protein